MVLTFFCNTTVSKVIDPPPHVQSVSVMLKDLPRMYTYSVSTLLKDLPLIYCVCLKDYPPPHVLCMLE